MGGINLHRQVLLFGIERRCKFAECEDRLFTSLTKQKAFDYVGFECTDCERWDDDWLSTNDIPDWWEEFTAHQQSLD
jgi:hypothetical protein